MTENTNNEFNPDEFDLIEVEENEDAGEALDEGKRRFLLGIQFILLLGIGLFVYLGVRYLISPQPISQMIPAVNVANNAPPIFKFSFPLDEPGGVAASPDNQRIYSFESSGDRLIKLFDRDGEFLTSFAPPYTNKSNRKYGYIAVAPNGNVFISDTYNDVIAIFDADGNFIDGIIGRDMTISKWISSVTGQVPEDGTIMYYDLINHRIQYQEPGKATQVIADVNLTEWSPVGIRFDSEGNLLITNMVATKHSVVVFPSGSIAEKFSEFSPQVVEFGQEGNGSGQFSFPNAVVEDSKGNYYISDGNNGRISVWTSEPSYSGFFGFGSNDQSLNLPRGIWMDVNDRLFVADSVGQYIRVYDVSGEEPAFLYNIGEFGLDDGYFNFPADIFIDGTGRMYVADRKNSRVQVWSY